MSRMSFLTESREEAVAEVLGLEGPYSFPEKLLQRLWARREYDARGATVADGRAIRVLHPGKWNHLGGPDFLGARLQLGGEAVAGDVEVHLRASDWVAHGHARDPAYDNVVLHVVLFPAVECFTPGVDGRRIPILALLPRLFHDLEEYAADAAIEALANRPSARLLDELGGLPPGELAARLRRHALERWRQKVRFAQLRIRRLGWAQACHHTALEILGYRFNRVPLLRIAAAHPLEQWTAGGVDPDAVFATEAGNWCVQGVRPANHPRTRLRQYAAWARAAPDWPERLRRLAAGLPAIAAEAEIGTAHVRRAQGFVARRQALARDVCAQAVGGTRLDNLICDGFWPLLAAAGTRPEAEAHVWWFHWFPGDQPARVRPGLKDLGVCGGAGAPACQGAAQGLLGWMLAQEEAR